MRKEKVNIERLKHRMKENKVKEGEVSMSHHTQSMMDSYGGHDHNPVVSPASRERDNLSPGSIHTATRGVGKPQPEANIVENPTEASNLGDPPAGQANQHQILQNHILKESTEQYQNDHKPKKEEDERAARTADNDEQKSLVNQGAPSLPGDEEKERAAAQTEDGVPPVAETEVPGQPGQAAEGRDGPLIDQSEQN